MFVVFRGGVRCIIFEAKSAVGVDPIHVTAALVEQKFVTSEKENMKPEVGCNVTSLPTVNIDNVVSFGRIIIHVNIRVVKVIKGRVVGK